MALYMGGPLGPHYQARPAIPATSAPCFLTNIPTHGVVPWNHPLSTPMHGWCGISRFAQGIALSVIRWIDQICAAATSVVDTMIQGGLQPCLATAGARSLTEAHTEDPRTRGLSRMIMDGPGGSFMILSASGGPATYHYTHTVDEFRDLLRREGYSEAEITVEIARLDWNWRHAKNQTRIAEAKHGPLPEGWAATGDVQHVSVTINEDGSIKDWTPLGALTDRQRATMIVRLALGKRSPTH